MMTRISTLCRPLIFLYNPRKRECPFPNPAILPKDLPPSDLAGHLPELDSTSQETGVIPLIIPQSWAFLEKPSHQPHNTRCSPLDNTLACHPSSLLSKLSITSSQSTTERHALSNGRSGYHTWALSHFFR